MQDADERQISIDAGLRKRLTALAKRSGVTLEDYAENALRAQADRDEGVLAEVDDDEARWQRYLQTGTTIPASKVRKRLEALAEEAAAKAKSR